MKQTAAKRRLRHKTTRRHIKRQYEGGVGPVHAVGAMLEAHHVQSSFFAMLSMATKNKDLNVVNGLVYGLGALGVTVANVATGGLVMVGIFLVMVTAMTIYQNIQKYKKLQGTVMALIQVLRKIQKTMMLCITMSSHYNVEINTHDLNVCLSKIYASLDELLTPETRNTVKEYARNYNSKNISDVGQAADGLIEEKSSRFANFGKRISTAISQARFNSDAKEQELRELMNELTPFLTLLLSQTVLQFMVCQTSMITDGASEKLKIGNDAVKESCQYKDFQLSALLDSIMRITADLDREPANRVSHIEALTKEVIRITATVTNNLNYTSFKALQDKLQDLSKLIAAFNANPSNYDGLRAALTDLNTYDEQVFFKECTGPTPQFDSKSTASSKTSQGSVDSLPRFSKNPTTSTEPLLEHDDNVGSGVSVDSIGPENIELSVFTPKNTPRTESRRTQSAP